MRQPSAGGAETEGGPAIGGAPGPRFWVWIALASLFLVAFGMRVSRPVVWETPGGVFFRDPDTVRRLARLEGAPAGEEGRDPRDGYPAGTAIHWTAPMDWLLVSLDAVVPGIHPTARRYESGAAWAGPLLGAIGALAFALVAMRLLGAGAGSAAGWLYAMGVPLLQTTGYGNGDHQSLQHLGAAVATLVVACVAAGRAGRALAVTGGAALGLSLWVSTESMSVLALTAAAAAVSTWWIPAADRGRASGLHATWAAACLAVVGIGVAIEQGTHFPAFEWDRVSGFQLAAVAAVLVYFALSRALEGRMPARATVAPVVAGACALVWVLLPFALVPSWRGAVVEEWEGLRAAQAWAAACVAEYQPLLAPGGVFGFQSATLLFSHAVWLLPLVVVGLAMSPVLSGAGRVMLLLLAAGHFALACLEIKLAHFFSITYPLVLVVGGGWWAGLLGRSMGAAAVKPARGLGFAACLALLVVAARPFSVDAAAERDRAAQQPRMEMLQAVARLAADGSSPGRAAALALWDQGAHLMYYGRVPAVASAYHRNLAGIRDAFAVLTATTWAEAERLLRRRGVRWLVWGADPAFLFQIERAFPELGRFGTVHREERGGRLATRLSFEPRTERTVWKSLLDDRPAPFLRKVYESPHMRPVAGRVAPAFRVFEVSPGR